MNEPFLARRSCKLRTGAVRFHEHRLMDELGVTTNMELLWVSASTEQKVSAFCP